MLPCFTANNLVYRRLPNAILCGKFGCTVYSRFVAHTYFLNQRWRQFRMVRAKSLSLSTLIVSVGHIIRRQPQEQVCRVDAGWPITSVTDKMPLWNWTIYQLPSYTMSTKLIPPCVLEQFKYSVSSAYNHAVPKPTLTRLINMGPKAISVLCRILQGKTSIVVSSGIIPLLEGI